MPAHLHSTGIGHMAVASPAAALQTLNAHQTLSIRPQTASVLRMVQGRVWVTTGAGQGVPGQPESGDCVLCAGQQLALPASAHVVVENWPQMLGEVAQFEVAAEVDVAQPVSLASCSTPAQQPQLQRCLPTRSLGLKPVA